MSVPIEKMIDASVSCTKCGTKGVGSCDCWTEENRDRKPIKQREARSIARKMIVELIRGALAQGTVGGWTCMDVDAAKVEQELERWIERLESQLAKEEKP